MPNVFRAYVPTVEFKFNRFFQKSLAVANASPILSVTVSSVLPHRKLWCALLNGTGVTGINFDLVATLNGREVFRQAIARSTGASQLFYAGFGTNNATYGSVAEQLFVLYNATNLYGVSAHRLNITADTFFVDTSANGGNVGTGPYDGYLFIQSQAGI